MEINSHIQKENLKLLFLFICLILLPPYMPVIIFWLGLILEHYLGGTGPGLFLFALMLLIGPIAQSSFFISALMIGYLIFSYSKNVLLRLAVVIFILIEMPLAFENWSSMRDYYVGWK